MAKIGLNNFRYGKLTEDKDGKASYDGAKTPGKAISCNVDITNNEAKLNADDITQESDTSFAGGTATIGIDREDLKTQADMLGHKYTEQDGIVRNTNDVAPYIGFGRVVTIMQDGTIKYQVKFLHKVKFAEPSQDESTKGENTEFKTTEMKGTVAQLANGDWSKDKIFNTKAEAITYLESLLAPTTENNELENGED